MFIDEHPLSIDDGVFLIARSTAGDWCSALKSLKSREIDGCYRRPYFTHGMAESSSTLIDELVDPLGQCLTPEVARRIIALRASANLEQRIERLGQKCKDGELTAEEKAEYETIVRFIKFVSTLQSKARGLLQNSAS